MIPLALTSTEPLCAREHRAPEKLTAAAACRAAHSQLLIDANINPRTGLATDYLNHFNEAIMLLELIPAMPECADDFLDWKPRSYREHFAASTFTARDLAVAAYEAADETLRNEFDNITASMTSILLAVGDAMREAHQQDTRILLAAQAANWVKPLAALAGSKIKGTGSDPDIDTIMNA